jgi:uncharacterized protein (DUF2147 family)
MMKAILIALTVMAAGSVPVQAQDVNGIWKTEPSDKGAYLHVRIGDCAAPAGEKCGVITEVFNSDNQDIKGRPIIWAMKPDGTNAWSGGRIWAPDDDKTYRSRMRLSGDTLSVEGCVLVICRGQDWQRVQ